jgi:curved DNA-binding protein CbpA
MGEGKLTSEQRDTCLARVRERKEAVDVALAGLAFVSDAELAANVSRHALYVLEQSLSAGAEYAHTALTGLERKLRGAPADATPLLDVRQEVLDIQVAYDRAKGQDFYQRLGIAETATADEVRKAYFDAAKRWHSDKFSGIELGAARATLERLFGLMSDANATLGDAAKRRDYDALRHREQQGLPTDVATILDAEECFKRGQVLLARGAPDAALAELERAVSANPGEAEFQAAYGFAIYLAKSNSEEALTTLRKALEMSPRSASAHEYMGRIYRAMGKIQEARRSFNKCLEIDAKNISAQRELRLMTMRDQKNEATPAKSGGLFSFLKK